MSAGMAKAARRARQRTTPAYLKPTAAVAGVLSLVVPAMWLMLRDTGGSAEAAGDSVPFSTMTDDRYPTKVVATQPTPSRTPSETPSEPPSETPSTTPSRTPRPTTGPSSTATDRPTFTATPTATSTPTGPARRPQTTTTPTKTTPKPSPTPTDDGDMTDAELARFQQVNDERARNGCSPVLPDSRLTHTARAQASYIDDADDLTHDDANGDGPRERMQAAGVTSSQLGEFLQADNSTGRWSGGAGDPATDCGVHRLGVGYDSGAVVSCVIIFCSSKGPIWVEDYSG
jgi:uncharacterized protein YkwD